MNEGQVKFLKDNAWGKTKRELIELFEDKFGITYTPGQITYYKKKYGIKSGHINRNPRLLTDEQLEWIKGYLPINDYSILIDLLKEKYGIDVTKQQLSNLFRHKGIKSGVVTYFPKGYVPANKGKRLSEAQKAKIRATLISRQIVSPNRMPVGSEYVRSDGFVHIKVANPNTWRMKHHVVWEMHYEPIKKNEMLIFLDGDRANCRIENLMLVNRAENNLMNRNHMRSKDAEITKTGVLIAKLRVLKSEKLKRRKGQ